ncbi:MAG: 50S ribosomal protein L21 [Candidatus Aureabacteria bacterium]|nr:50S ribosomal protein L21 [Candidatus Auribacterota bacterium]
MYAVIETGSKQYKVEKDDIIDIELTGKKPGEKIDFERVLLIADKNDVKIGTPLVKDAKVAGEVLAEKKGRKLIAFFYRRRKDSKRKVGHRQKCLSVKISEISAK